MNPTPDASFPSEPIDQQAADWVMRSERGLTAAEQDEFLHWLVADQRHGAAVARHKQNWQRLDQLGEWRPEHSAQPNRDLLAPRPQPVLSRFHAARAWWLPLAAAAALVVGGFFYWSRPAQPVTPELAAIATIEQRTLDDGSVIELNRGAEVVVRYTAGERRVELVRGEAHFTVAKNKERPFIVSAGGVAVRAVGTAFNVQLATAAVNVLVTEGVVQVAPPTMANAQPSALNAHPLELSIGERTSISLGDEVAPPQVSIATPEQMATILAWQPRLLDFTATPLLGIVAEFNRRNAPLHLVIADATLANTEISATLRSDNIEGFICLLEAGFGVRAEREGDTIRLRKAP